ncbi:hypothetical protein ACET3Z_026214 [Daucus carota]
MISFAASKYQKPGKLNANEVSEDIMLKMGNESEQNKNVVARVADGPSEVRKAAFKMRGARALLNFPHLIGSSEPTRVNSRNRSVAEAYASAASSVEELPPKKRRKDEICLTLHI